MPFLQKEFYADRPKYHIMLSNGEIYHMAFRLWEETIRERWQLSLVELRDYLKVLNKQDLSKQDMEAKAREWIKEKIKSK